MTLPIPCAIGANATHANEDQKKAIQHVLKAQHQYQAFYWMV
jgi:hypothetical protein